MRPTVDVMVELETPGTKLNELSGAEVEAALRRERAESGAERGHLAAQLEAIQGSRGWRLILLLTEPAAGFQALIRQ